MQIIKQEEPEWQNNSAKLLFQDLLSKLFSSSYIQHSAKAKHMYHLTKKARERNIQESTFLDQVTDFRRLFNFSLTNIYMTNEKPDKHFGAEQGKFQEKPRTFTQMIGPNYIVMQT